MAGERAPVLLRRHEYASCIITFTYLVLSVLFISSAMLLPCAVQGETCGAYHVSFI